MKVKGYPKKVLLQFGRNLAKLRREAGWTQEVLAEKVDLNVRHLQKIEAGEVSPSFGSIHRLRSALEVSWNLLMRGAE